MNNRLVENNYLVIPNFISSYRASELSSDFSEYARSKNLDGDSQAPSSHSSYNYISFLELLCEKTPDVSEILEEKVLPTYAYARVYKNGSILHPHTDRDSCEISLTVHLSGDAPWNIWIETPQKEKKTVTLNPGDAMLYLGCIAKHWREEYTGENYTQVFLHYVRSRGERADFYFDRKTQHKDMNQVLEDKCEEVTQETTEEESNISRIEVTKTNISSTQKLEDFIFVFDDVMSEDLCERIIKEYSNPAEWRDTLIGTKTVDKRVRNCREIPLSIDEVIQKNIDIRKQLDNEIFQSVSKSISLYVEKYPKLVLQQDSGYQFLKYEKGEFYVQHTDSYINEPRHVSCSFQLNDDYLGGEFAFFNREIMIRSKRGSVIMFPSNFMFPHEVMPVTEGTRYSIVTWIL